MRLRELIGAVAGGEAAGHDDPEIDDLAYDSRRAGPGTLFFCVRGSSSDGHDFAAQAVERGAAALVVERPLGLGVPEVRVSDARAAMAPLAVELWGDPTSSLAVVGVTGTNGKTTTAFLVRDILEAAGRRCGLLGTVKRIVGGTEHEVERTTPEAIDLQSAFRRMLDCGDVACAMEVSSHALELGRTEGTRFSVACFTNLTRDHLDFHGDMEAYFAAKRRLFAAPGGRAAATPVPVVNVDDPFGRRLAGELAHLGADPRTYSVSGAADADFRASAISFDPSGSRFRCLTADEELEVRMPLPGPFNVENGLAALACAEAVGVEPPVAAAALAGARRVPGRLEPVEEGQHFAVLVDYAHTPDSLENVLGATRELTANRLICVFGCGGDRDRDKRPLMGEAVARLADLPIVTSDNPRSEDPDAIIEEVMMGIDRADIEVEPDRRAAIALALERARPGDAVLIAGKGHEQGQELAAGRSVPFDDREVAREQLRRIAGREGADRTARA